MVSNSKSKGQKSKVTAWIPRQEIEQKARDILRQHGLETIPINPVLLANKLGIKVNNAKFSDDSISAMIARRGENILLLVAQDDPPFRKRFSIAHELGHHFLHLLEDGEFIDKEADLFRGLEEEAEEEDLTSLTEKRRQEIQSNIFAAALLMPKDIVLEEYKKGLTTEQMAIRFGVSKEAIAIRLSQLRLI
jgi:Zn-dependent peptidase ImmA (M78 family)